MICEWSWMPGWISSVLLKTVIYIFCLLSLFPNLPLSSFSLSSRMHNPPMQWIISVSSAVDDDDEYTPISSLIQEAPNGSVVVKLANSCNLCEVYCDPGEKGVFLVPWPTQRDYLNNWIFIAGPPPHQAIVRWDLRDWSASLHIWTYSHLLHSRTGRRDSISCGHLVAERMVNGVVNDDDGMMKQRMTFAIHRQLCWPSYGPADIYLLCT